MALLGLDWRYRENVKSLGLTELFSLTMLLLFTLCFTFLPADVMFPRKPAQIVLSSGFDASMRDFEVILCVSLVVHSVAGVSLLAGLYLQRPYYIATYLLVKCAALMMVSCASYFCFLRLSEGAAYVVLWLASMLMWIMQFSSLDLTAKIMRALKVEANANVPTTTTTSSEPGGLIHI